MGVGTKQRKVYEDELDLALTFPEVFKARKGLSDNQYRDYVESLQHKIEASKRGKRSRDKGNDYERRVAKVFNKKLGTVLVRTPMSGGFHKAEDSEMKGDLVNLDPDMQFNLQPECKNHKVLRVKDWIKQAEEEAREGKIPVVVFHKHRELEHGDRGKMLESAGDYVIISLNDFVEIIDANKVLTPVKKVERKKLRRVRK